MSMITFSALRSRLVREYPLSLLASYVAIGVGILAQVVLVPVYLATLGAETFGVLMLMLALINYAAIGGGWLIGGLQRILGETFGTNDPAGFVHTLDTGKLIYTSYAVVVALIGIAVFAGFDQLHVPLSVAIVAALYLVATYELSVERVALTAAARLSMAYLLQIAQVVSYTASVVIVLQAGGGLLGAFICQLGSVLVARMVVPLCWQGQRPHVENIIGSFRALWSRLTGRMGGGYFIASALAISSQADLLVVGWLGGAQDAARYVLVWKIAEVGVLVLSRMPENLAPIVVRLDAVGDRATIKRVYVRIAKLLLALAIPGGIAYALLGSWIMTLWVGAENAPQDHLGFVLAGAAMVWIGIARLPSLLAYALARLRVWNMIAFVELAARLGLTVALYPRFGYLSPLVALNVVHLCGVAFAYQWTGARLLAGRL